MDGPAVADVLFGDVNPGGKLPVTFPRHPGQIPIFYGQRPTGRPTTDDRWTSKYVDEQVHPLYRFGHDLSYTRFTYSDVAVQPSAVPTSGSITVSVKVRNTGSREGKEVVQLYVRDPIAGRSRPLRELKGFQKVS